MKHWRLVLRVAFDSRVLEDASELKRNVAVLLRVVETYEIACLGMRMFGIDFLAEDEEFNHIMRLIRILETRYRLSLMQFSELNDTKELGMTIRIGSQSATHVA
ncbi:hypothetical protein F0A17_17950 [Billgrantia pellis]|uniref:Uncharacterized protein n=1 Tax=Billgrantia pellis TaxID=2606936 RepID=A0A7V7FX40_9GAMM|nr:hypothetical protein [Halomonas pellis]KAA0010347.1 hypothetical protein F0A17_17950 [Halomonas pellis]